MVKFKPNSIRCSSYRRIRPQRTPLVIDSPAKAAYAARLTREFKDDGRERFGVLLLDNASQVLGFHLVSVGSADASLASPREVFAPALRELGVTRVILVHSHPSGDPRASLPDITLTRELLKAGRLLDIDVLDHVILGDGGQWSSMNQDGLLTFDGRSGEKKATTTPKH